MTLSRVTIKGYSKLFYCQPPLVKNLILLVHLVGMIKPCHTRQVIKCKLVLGFMLSSVFFIFNLTNVETGEKIVGKDALEITIELAQEAAHYSTMFLKPPMNLAYEKTLMPFALLSKKRYVGILYEEDLNKGKLKYMGL